jgi:hypothetical protein
MLKANERQGFRKKMRWRSDEAAWKRRQQSQSELCRVDVITEIKPFGRID